MKADQSVAGISADPGEGPDVSLIRRVVLVSLSAAFVLALAIIVTRGTRARTGEHDARSVSDGIISYLRVTEDGHKEVRCSAVVQASSDRAWSVVTDYEHFPDIFESALWRMRIDRVERSGDEVRLLGAVVSRLRTFPVDVRIRHRGSPSERTASWDSSTGSGQVNRGRWIVSPWSPTETLLVYAVEVKVDRYPSFLINNVLLSEAPNAIAAVQKRLGSAVPVGSAGSPP